ncbi:tetratricopeptide repeat protein (macronuclear) [Tetrahymena thermophila SB210]|uniref:Tetratricopeptide repeat protein n=1 Tax=Tetrahymena thermophila (strain SB210) TaxID=312017 RepID=I7MEG4_TETTS|nr:tetratricopeptide repeat protein [Tetrahymena thermophila SB210]EAR96307.2 tetratricopeptide repeat protein [Tetrahymena thermophila SB210]|eukprot:XP_001016552.2 tetratricopeptide repeat protein [Tetrahymena thermophila SB210]
MISKHSQAFEQLGYLFNKKEMYDNDAITLIQKADQLDPKDSWEGLSFLKKEIWAFGKLGYLFYKKEMYDHAIPFFQKAVQLEHKYSWDYHF